MVPLDINMFTFFNPNVCDKPALCFYSRNNSCFAHQKIIFWVFFFFVVFILFFAFLHHFTLFLKTPVVENGSSWKITNLIRSNRLDQTVSTSSANDKSSSSEASGSQPPSAASSAAPSPARSKRGINLLPEVVRLNP